MEFNKARQGIQAAAVFRQTALLKLTNSRSGSTGIVLGDALVESDVLAVPSVERHVPYVTQAYAIMVLEGTYGDGQRSAMRLPGWEILLNSTRPFWSASITMVDKMSAPLH